MTDNIKDQEPEFVPDKWIDKARSNAYSATDDTHAFLTVNWGSLALDGRRIHYDPTIPFHDDPIIEFSADRMELVVEWLKSDEKMKSIAKCDPTLLLKAARTCKKESSVLKMYFAKSSSTLTILPQMQSIPKEFSVPEVHCTYTGSKAEILIDAKYLIDALMGMDKKKQVVMSFDKKSIHITDGNRIAFVMLMAVR